MLIILAFFDEYTCSSAVLILIMIMIEYNQEVFFVYTERYRLTVLSTSIHYTVLGIQLSCNVLVFAFRFCL